MTEEASGDTAQGGTGDGPESFREPPSTEAVVNFVVDMEKKLNKEIESLVASGASATSGVSGVAVVGAGGAAGAPLMHNPFFLGTLPKTSSVPMSISLSAAVTFVVSSGSPSSTTSLLSLSSEADKLRGKPGPPREFSESAGSTGSGGSSGNEEDQKRESLKVWMRVHEHLKQYLEHIESSPLRKDEGGRWLDLDFCSQIIGVSCLLSSLLLDLLLFPPSSLASFSSLTSFLSSLLGLLLLLLFPLCL
jgi:hypothetical protein